MSPNNKVVCASVLLVCTAFANAQMMTITEKSLKQSEIARAEMESRLSQIRKKDEAKILPINPLLTSKNADEILNLISVYGVGEKLKADFQFQGGIVTLEPNGATEAAGWNVEKLTPTEAVLIKRNGKKVVKRSTLYLTPEAGQQSAKHADLASMGMQPPMPYPLPSMPLPANGIVADGQSVVPALTSK